MTTTQSKKNYALPIAMMIILFGMISFVTGLQNPMGVIVKTQFGASNFMSQLGNAANFIAYAFMGIPAGMLLQKIGYKKTALLAIIVGLIGVFIQYLSGQASSFAVYLCGAFIGGFSMCMLNTVVNPMLNTLGGGGRKGNQLIQIGGTFNSLNATIVPVLVGYFIGNSVRPSIKDANPALYIAMAIFAIVFIVLYFVNIPEPHSEQKKEEKKEKSKYSAFSFRHYVLGTIAIFVYVGVEVGIPNISNLFMTTKTTEQLEAYKIEYSKQTSDPDYLATLKADAERTLHEANQARDSKSADIKEKVEMAKNAAGKIISEEDYNKAISNKIPGLGMDTTTAGTIVGTYWFLMLIGRFLGAWLGAKFSSKAMLTFASSLGLVFILLAIFSNINSTVSMPVFKSDISFSMTQVPISIMFLVLCGLCTSVMWGGIFNLAVEGLGKYLAAASGFFMVMVCGGGILPLIQGFAVDFVGYIASYWIIFAGIAYLLYYALVGSKNVNQDIPVN